MRHRTARTSLRDAARTASSVTIVDIASRLLAELEREKVTKCAKKLSQNS
ncbi:hypothetical protein [Nostoc sp.]